LRLFNCLLISYKSVFVQAYKNDIVLLILVITCILLLLLTFIAAVLFLYQKKSVLYFRQLEEVKNVYEKNLLQTQIEIQEQAFLNISQEIHDNIGLSLTLAKLQLNTIDYNSQPRLIEKINSSIDLITKGIQDLSDISKTFNSDAIKTHGLYNTLKLEAERINRSEKHTVEFTEEGNITFMDAHKELILYRIAQEALNNTLKYANASNIWIKLIYQASHLELWVEDDGKGFDQNEIIKHRSDKLPTGLCNMRNRASTLSGTCTIDSVPGKGTRICVTTPYL
jgi:two-component system, NarL family, sensor kinase